MSVTFNAIGSDGFPVGERQRRETACLCAQGCDGWTMYPSESLRPALAEHADPSCHFCGGTGVEVEEVNDLFLNLCNGNARALLALLGLREAWGTVDIAGARRAIMLARATFDRRAPALTREPVTEHAPARVEHEGNVARVVPGATFHTGGFSATDLRDRLDAFAELVETGARLGAIAISWG